MLSREYSLPKATQRQWGVPEAEAKKLAQAARCEPGEARHDNRSGHYDRNLTTHVPRTPSQGHLFRDCHH